MGKKGKAQELKGSLCTRGVLERAGKVRGGEEKMRAGLK